MAGLSDANTNIKATTVAFSSLYTDISLAFKEHPVKKTIFSRNPILRGFMKEISLNADQIKKSKFPKILKIQGTSPVPDFFKNRILGLFGFLTYFPCCF